MEKDNEWHLSALLTKPKVYDLNDLINQNIM